MLTIFDALDEVVEAGPLVGEADVVGLYRPDVAAAASGETACDSGSSIQMDD